MNDTQIAKRILGRHGVWNWLDGFSRDESVAFSRKIEALGYQSLWLPEAIGRDPFAQAALLSAHTDRLGFATGIANLYARDPMNMNALRKTMGDVTGGRFVLGIGVSHAHLVTGVRGHEYQKPVTTMRSYLDGMEKAMYRAPEGPHDTPVVLAAAHPYFTPPEHTARAREILGPDALLAPEQMVLLEPDATKARATARENMKIYMGLPNYLNNLRWMGFDETDLADGGSDKLVDAIVAWGDETALRKRVDEHFAAGADHVCIQALHPEGQGIPDMKALELLAPGA
jgi:probable F420-dependent oxidoreductase